MSPRARDTPAAAGLTAPEPREAPPTLVEGDPGAAAAGERKGVIGWVKGKIQKRNTAANMNNIDLDEAEKDALAATSTEPSDLDIAMGLGDGGVVLDDDVVAEEDKIDLEAENDEGLLVGWGKRLQEVEWVQKTVQVVQDEVANRQHQEEMREIHEKFGQQIKDDPDIKALQKKIKKIKKNLKVQRLNGDRIAKRNGFQREKEQKELDKKTARLSKAIWTFSYSSMNSHEYAKAMMRASARLQRKGFQVHKSEKALAMEAAVLRNMHRMLVVQKQYTMSKRACNDVSSFIKRCKGWLENKLANGEMGIMVLEATSKSMAIMYQETVDVQEALKPKLEDPANHTFKKERLKTVLALPKGLRSMPTFLKGPSRPPMRISLRKKIVEDEDPNLKGYRTFKEQTKAMEKAWKEELKNYENLLEVGGNDTKVIEDVSDLGDSEDEIEANLASVRKAAAAAAVVGHVDLEQMVKEQKGVHFAPGEEAAEEAAVAEGVKMAEADNATAASGSLATGGGDPLASSKKSHGSKSSGEGLPAVEETKSAEEADAAALEEAQKNTAVGDADPEVDETALPEEVKQEDLDNLLNKEAEESGHLETGEVEEAQDNTVEEGLHQVVEDALAGVGTEADVSENDEEDEPAAAEAGGEEEDEGGATVQSEEVSV